MVVQVQEMIRLNEQVQIFQVDLIENKKYVVMMEFQHKNLLDDHDRYNHLINRNSMLLKFERSTYNRMSIANLMEIHALLTV
jgi:hypothetical protein